MFRKHPKELRAAILANMGERFGFYTMMAVLSLFLMSKFGLSGTKAGIIYSIFYFSTHVLALSGGLIADKTRNFKGTILVGLILMTVGYSLIAIPTPTPVPEASFVLFLAITCGGLFVIAFGSGLFRGNMQALIGQMYDKSRYSRMRDAGFSLYYMFISVGALFAPLVAIGVRNWWVVHNGFKYNPVLPELCHEHLKGILSPENTIKFQELATSSGFQGTDLTGFAEKYLNVFATGFHYAFAVSIFVMFISLVIYLFNKRKFSNPTYTEEVVGVDVQNGETSVKEAKQGLYALFAVLAVVVFFWFSFHQNGLTLTYFAKDFTDLSRLRINLGFTVLEGAEIFQSVNPLFILLLNPVAMVVFGVLSARRKELSLAKSIALGMGIAACAYILMAVGSAGLPNKTELTAMGGEVERVTPFLLLGTYFILAIAEIFLSPLGISYVSKVSPLKYQGMMQGLWICATAVGNLLLFIGVVFYESKSIPLAVTWIIFAIICLLSMIIMLRLSKRVRKQGRGGI
jgi:POT family proton-dependent oligopeptide transporter